MQLSTSHGHLETILDVPESIRAASPVCHPHPQYGGTMHTKAIYHTAKGLVDSGIVALRFNFRGVGQSTGEYDEGEGERDDVRAVIEYLETNYSVPLMVTGFSFGAWVSLRVGVEDPRVKVLTGLGLPVTMYDFSFLNDLRTPLLVLQAEDDEFATPDDIRSEDWSTNSLVTVKSVPDTGHLFTGQFERIKDHIRQFMDKPEISADLERD